MSGRNRLTASEYTRDSSELQSPANGLVRLDLDGDVSWRRLALGQQLQTARSRWKLGLDKGRRAELAVSGIHF